MHRFKNILFVAGPGDGTGDDGPALERAVALARTNEGRLTLAAVMEAEPEGWVEETAGEAAGLRARIEETHRSRLEGLAVTARGMGTEPGTLLLHGRPFVAVIGAVLEGGYDLVMKEAEGPSEGIRGRLFGSTDQHLQRKCPCPVWLFKPGQTGEFQSVLAAVDVEGESWDELNARVIQLASSLAVREGAELHVVHAWSLYAESILRSRGRGITSARLRTLLRETKQTRARRLSALVRTEAATGSRPELHLVKARPALGIRQVARRVDADVVVMGTLSRAGMMGVLIGNTAELVLSQLTCSALTVKPEDFRSPLDVAPPPVPAGD